MNPTELRKSLENGVIAFPVTPFKDDLSLDLEGLVPTLNGWFNTTFGPLSPQGELERCIHCRWTNIDKW